MRYIISLTLILAAMWLAVSGVYKFLILLLGAGSIAMVVWLSHRMKVIGVEHNPVLFSWRLPVYWIWLIGQIVLANINVARAVLAPGRISPSVHKVPVRYKSDVARVTYANSVTLTPGTVALYLTEDELTVHALDSYSARGLEEGKMVERIEWLKTGRKNSARNNGGDS